jgi:hypothetical protein
MKMNFFIIFILEKNMFEFLWIKNQALQKHKCENIDIIL